MSDVALRLRPLENYPFPLIKHWEIVEIAIGDISLVTFTYFRFFLFTCIANFSTTTKK